MFQEFKKFIARGNMIDLAVGVLIGAAFGRIVTSLTESVIMPVIGWIFGTVDFSNHFLLLGPVPADYKGSLQNYAALREAGVPMLGYGDFLTQLINFLIVAMALFALLKAINAAVDEVHHEQEEAATEAPADPQIDLLTEIRDELRKRR
jgi:large conductance mechanosensitive channel